LSEAQFPERLLMDDKISEGHSEYLDSLIGRSPFIKNAEFMGLVNQLLPEASGHLKRVARVLASAVFDDVPSGMKQNLRESFAVQIAHYAGGGHNKKSGRIGGKESAVVALLRDKHPNGVPLGMSEKTLRDDLLAAAPYLDDISPSTLTRARKKAYLPQSS